MLVIEKDQTGFGERVRLDGKETEKGDKFNYLEVIITKRGMREVNHWMLEERKVWGSMGRLWKESRISTNVKRALYE